MTTAEDDFNLIPDIEDAIEYIASHQIEIGIFGEDDSELLMIARVQEYGVEIQVTEAMRNYLHSIGMHLRKETDSINIPERSFMRAGFDTRKEQLINTAEKLLNQAMLLEIEPEVALETIGVQMQTTIQEYLTNVNAPPNHPLTIRRKGSSNPLIDEGRLRSAITYKIRSR